VSAVGTALFLYVRARVLFQFQAKHIADIIYESEYWIGTSTELRIHHYLFGYNAIVVSLIVFLFFIITFRLLILYS